MADPIRDIRGRVTTMRRKVGDAVAAAEDARARALVPVRAEEEPDAVKKIPILKRIDHILDCPNTE